MQSLQVFAGNVGFALSYWIFPNSYDLYRAQKRLFNRAFRCNAPVAAHQVVRPGDCVIQGFRHSGNSFLISNVVEEDRAGVPTDLHRIWMVQEAVKNEAVVIVLIRNPLEVALSTYFRTAADCTRHTPFQLFPWAVLAGWIGYSLDRGPAQKGHGLIDGHGPTRLRALQAACRRVRGDSPARGSGLDQPQPVSG